MEILTNFAIQILLTFGVVTLFGFIIALSRNIFNHLLGPAGYRILIATGLIGTPIHELSHALMCLIFGHGIKEIKFFDPKAKSGALGYVMHSYNPKNVYHLIGGYFIGVAPIICGSGVLLLLMKFMIPDVFASVMVDVGVIKDYDLSLTKDTFVFFGMTLLSILGKIFSFSNFENIWWWVFIVIALMIACHMELSGPDIKGGIKGFFIICAMLLVADAIVGLLAPTVLSAMTSGMIGVSAFIISFLFISAVFSVILVLIAIVVRSIRIIFRI